MRRRQRIHVRDGVYFVRMQVYDSRELVVDATDAAELSRNVAKAATACDALIHAYRWGRRRADLLIQIATQPLGNTIQRINGPFSQYAQSARGLDGPLFRRYRAALVLSETHVLQLVRYIHWLPVREGAVSSVDAYAWSSHHDYAGVRRTSWLTTALVRRLLAQRIGGRDRDAYARWMAEPISQRQAKLFENSDGYLPTRTGDPLQLERSAAKTNGATLTRKDLEPLISEVCGIVGITHDQALSRSRVAKAVLARALIARHAVREGLGNLADVARCIEKDPTALQRAISSYADKYPAVFSKALPMAAKRRP